MPAIVRDSQYLNAARASYHRPEDKTFSIWSSDCYCAWLIGRYLKTTGRSEPWHVYKSHGYYWKVNDMTFKWLGQQPEIEWRKPETTFKRID